MEVNTDDYFTYEARLASFKTAHKRRGSARGKAMRWPHAHLKAEAVSSFPLPIISPRHPATAPSTAPACWRSPADGDTLSPCPKNGFPLQTILPCLSMTGWLDPLYCRRQS